MGRHVVVTRRRFLQLLAGSSAALLARCAPAPGPTPSPEAPMPTETAIGPEPTPGRPASYLLPTEEGAWVPPASHAGEMPAGIGTVGIEDLGEFTFDTSQVETLRPDIFQPGHFSMFDALVHAAEHNDLELEYHFEEPMDSHAIDAINGQSGWWYRAQYSGGWTEANAFRMDMYPYKNGTKLWVHRENDARLDAIYTSFREELNRLATNGGQVIIPDVTIRSPDWTRIFQDVPVTAHDVRGDLLQPGVVTALDALLSLGEQAELSRLKLTWYERIGTADPVDTYYVEQIDDVESYDRCGFVYEAGKRGLAGNHIHVPSDVRVTVSPEYALWFWICI